jgi:predicted GNAT superfamily acetyltransferase
MPQAKSQGTPRPEWLSAPAGYVIRPCRGMGELEACVHLQQQVWGYEPAEVYPVRLLVNLTHIGGHVLGAFQPRSTGRGARATIAQGGELVGFVMAMPAWRDRQRYLHSLSLAVAPGHENHGLGRLLKLGQRELAIQEGIARIEWTFDPLRAKNAFLNIERLGAITRRYQPDYYGSVHSRLQQGLPSDRLVSEWWVRSARVRRALEAAPRERRHVSGKPAAEIAIPADFGSLAERDPGRALEVQRTVRRKFERCFKRGLVVTGFERGEGVGRYILEAHQTQRHRGTEKR